jgi:hypothetical protein
MPSVSWISPPLPRGWLRIIAVEHAGMRQDVAAGHAQARGRLSGGAGFSTIFR